LVDRRLLYALLFGILVAFYALTFDARNITDTDLNSLQTRALALHGDVDLTRYDPPEKALWVEWRGDKYSIYGVGVSLPALPLYAVMARMDVADTTLQAAAAIPFVAAAVLVLYHVLLKLFSPANATAGAVLFAFGTTLWPVASMAFYQNAATALFQAIGLGGLFSKSSRAPWIAGLGFGVATLVRPISAIPLLFVGVFYLASDRKNAFRYGLGAALPILAIVVQNRWIWGGWFTGGYSHNVAGYRGNVPHAMWALTFGWWRGLFIYSPFLFAGVVGFVLAVRRARGFLESRLILLGVISLATLVLFAKFTTWHNGLTQFGYRYMLDAVPFLIVLCVYALDRLPRARSWFVPLAVVSVLTMVFGSQPNRYSWDFNLFPQRFVDSSIGQAWTVAVNYPAGNLARAAGVAAVAAAMFASARILAPGELPSASGPA
jgi:hypothetical protein